MNQEEKHLLKTARTTGVWYLIMAIGGVVGFMTLHSQIYIKNDPVQTLANLTEKETLARVRLIMEFVIIVSQALTAVWFYKLFRERNEWAAWTLGIWGMMNSAMIMVSAIAMGTAIQIATSAQAIESKVILIQLLERIIANSWNVGGLFFGLWLIPMGYIVIQSKAMPVWLGRVLVAGGFGYLLNAFIKYLGYNGLVVDMLVLPASVGEFWMIGYLLIFGIRLSGNGEKL